MCSLDTVQALRWDVDETQTHPVKCLTDVLNPACPGSRTGNGGWVGRGLGQAEQKERRSGSKGCQPCALLSFKLYHSPPRGVKLPPDTRRSPDPCPQLATPFSLPTPPPAQHCLTLTPGRPAVSVHLSPSESCLSVACLPHPPDPVTHTSRVVAQNGARPGHPAPAQTGQGSGVSGLMATPEPKL